MNIGVFKISIDGTTCCSCLFTVLIAFVDVVDSLKLNVDFIRNRYITCYICQSNDVTYKPKLIYLSLTSCQMKLSYAKRRKKYINRFLTNRYVISFDHYVTRNILHIFKISTQTQRNSLRHVRQGCQLHYDLNRMSLKNSETLRH